MVAPPQKILGTSPGYIVRLENGVCPGFSSLGNTLRVRKNRGRPHYGYILAEAPCKNGGARRSVTVRPAHNAILFFINTNISRKGVHALRVHEDVATVLGPSGRHGRTKSKRIGPSALGNGWSWSIWSAIVHIPFIRPSCLFR